MENNFTMRAKDVCLCLTDKQLEQFDLYYHILVEWNKVMNLTGITEYEEVYEKHFLDSLSVVKCCDLSQVSSVIDVGTGAGFPGIPLKIAFPEMKVVLLDSLNKRIRFLDEVIEKLGLTGIETIHGRAETLFPSSLERTEPGKMSPVLESKAGSRTTACGVAWVLAYLGFSILFS